MIPYCKIILEKMSFDSMLLKKEYEKCLSYLSHHEADAFKKWVKKQPFYSELKQSEMQHNEV